MTYSKRAWHLRVKASQEMEAASDLSHFTKSRKWGFQASWSKRGIIERLKQSLGARLLRWILSPPPVST